LAVAEEVGVAVETVLYMKKAERPDRATLEALLGMLEDPPEDLVRKDSRFKALELDPKAYVGNATAVVELLLEHSALMQRPVIVRGNRAIIGRPRDRVKPFIS